MESRTDQLRNLLAQNKIVIFPSEKIHAWDHLPRFKFLEADLRRLKNTKKSENRKRQQTLKDSFIGSPSGGPQRKTPGNKEWKGSARSSFSSDSSLESLNLPQMIPV